jgi:NADP-dependent aldehyde dehydrogenase
MQLDETETADAAWDAIAVRAANVAAEYAALPLRVRADGLVTIAMRLSQATDELVGIAAAETGLSTTRLTGELRRTCVQLRLFADLVRSGTFLDARLDERDPDFVLGPRPDLRRVLEPVGPVLNFAASNFPFAFSVAGGDTAAALAAGCPVIVKGHSGHPQLATTTEKIAGAALVEAGIPRDVLQIVFGQQAGVALIKHPKIRAGSFTGSFAVGNLLCKLAALRDVPIPFFGELSSVNPVYVTRQALTENREAIAAGYWSAVSGSAGQLCTKPGFLFGPADDAFTETLQSLSVDAEEHRLLTGSISRGYAERREAVLGVPGIDTLIEGSLRWDDDGQAWVRPTIVRASLAQLLQNEKHLLDEAFGPLSVIVTIGDEDLELLHRQLFPGNLTGSLFLGERESSPALKRFVRTLAETSGRVLFNNWPTGVAVTPAMQHGGPWPATTVDSTSVGTASIGRFLRGVTYQNAPQEFLPPALRDDDEWEVPQAHERAGRSGLWGSGHAGSELIAR